MRKTVSICAALLLAVASHAQTNQPTVATTDQFWQKIEEMLAKNNPDATNLYDPSAVEIRTGAVFAQNTGEAGVLIDGTKWFGSYGFGATVIEGNVNHNSAGQVTPTRGTMAVYAHGDYRRVIGNVAAKLSLGAGYDGVNLTPMGIVAGDVEYRFTKNLGSWVGLGYGLERAGNARGLIVGGGVSYSF